MGCTKELSKKIKKIKNSAPTPRTSTALAGEDTRLLRRCCQGACQRRGLASFFARAPLFAKLHRWEKSIGRIPHPPRSLLPEMGRRWKPRRWQRKGGWMCRATNSPLLAFSRVALDALFIQAQGKTQSLLAAENQTGQPNADTHSMAWQLSLHLSQAPKTTCAESQHPMMRCQCPFCQELDFKMRPRPELLYVYACVCV